MSCRVKGRTLSRHVIYMCILICLAVFMKNGMLRRQAVQPQEIRQEVSKRHKVIRFDLIRL